MSQRPTDQVFRPIIVCPLPYPWPPQEPEPDPGRDGLDQPINWMTYPHRDLYDMVHTGVDLSSANEVAAKWSRLGNQLDEMGQELRQALDAAADGWRGVAADEARSKVVQLAAWTEETADGSNEVSGCVSEQIDLASSAREAMPEPRPQFWPCDPPELDAFGGGSAGIASTGGTTPMSASSGFAGATGIVADELPNREQDRDLHRQAAEVMQRYQTQSRQLYDRVPAFTSPTPADLKERPPRDPRPPEPPRDPGEDDTTSSSTGSGGGGTGVVAGMPVGGAGAPAGGATTGGVTAGATGEQLAAGNRVGSAAAGPMGAQAGGAAAAAGGARGGMMGGAMPMGGAAGARPGGDELEHRAPSYLQEEDDLWGETHQVTPPVLGAEPSARGRDDQ